jgi:thioredoxin reductase (NADPH)
VIDPVDFISPLTWIPVMSKSSSANELVAGGSRHHQIFPTLDDKQFLLLERYGERRFINAGDVLFREGERHIPMFAIVSGSIEASRAAVDGRHTLGVHGPGSFTGEVSTLAGRGAVTTAVAQTDCEVLVIDEESLRVLVIAEADLSETIMRAFILRRVAFIQDQQSGVTVVGSFSCGATLGLRQFLSRNGQPAAFFDVAEHPEAKDFLQRYGVAVNELPVVITAQGTVLRHPTHRRLADAIGLSPDNLDGKTFDVIVVGAGPAGLAAAVYAASEGLRVVVVDSKAPGGQAGTSSKIENYFGFPTGISGQALAGRGLSQARKFGAEVGVPIEVQHLACQDGKSFSLTLDDNERVHAQAIIVATGARYRKPALERLEHFEGRGIYYSAAFVEASFCGNAEVIVVGGGNSAGQAAVFLSGHARHVHVIVRADGLAASMSNYLIRRVEAAANITLHVRTEIVELEGEQTLEGIKWRRQGVVEAMPICHVFLFLGAEPNTGWLADCVALDKNGFVLTGPNASPDWKLEREPLFLETSHPGVFAVGDVRSGSVKRVAAAVGEGAAAVQSLHQYLALMAPLAPEAPHAAAA